jgi:transcriptional regulator with XRE-family HTH domain
MPEFRFGALSEQDEVAAELEMQLESERQDDEIRHGQLGSVHENLRQFRIRNGFNKQSMAEIMDVTPRAYYSYEKGNRAIPSTALVKLAAFTRCDLNEILMGRLAPSNDQTRRSTVDDLKTTIEYLQQLYPSMNLKTRLEVACFVVKHDWEGTKRMTPGNIREAVKVVTRYRFHPESIPAPPYWEDYEDQTQYEAHMAQWEREVDEDLGALPGDTK